MRTPHALRVSLWVALTLSLSVPLADRAMAQEIPSSLCPIAIHEERRQLEEARLAHDLARSDFAVYDEIHEMALELWKHQAIERMRYTRMKYNRDTAELSLQRTALIVRRQEILVKQYRAVCDARDSKAYRSYLEAHCDSLAKSVEVSTVQLEYDRVLLASVLELRAADVATRPEVMLAELTAEKEAKRLKDARRRTEACRGELAAMKGSEAERNKP